MLGTETGYVQTTPPKKRHWGVGALVCAVSVIALLVGVVACTGDKVSEDLSDWVTSIMQTESATEADAAATSADTITEDGWRISTVGSSPLSVSYYTTVNDVVWLRLELDGTYELGYLYYQAASVELYYDGAALTSSVIITFDDDDDSALIGFEGEGALTFDVLTARVNDAGSVAWHTWDSITLLVEEV